MLGERLRLMFDWYKGMVDESTGRLLYLYDPENDVTYQSPLPPIIVPAAAINQIDETIWTRVVRRCCATFTS